MRPNGIEHTINGWLDRFRPGEQVRPASALSLSLRGRSVTVPSRLLEDEEDSLDDAAREVSRATMSALQKQIRADGFKGATVSGFSGPDAGGRPAAGFVVRYGGNDYAFAIEEIERAPAGKYSVLKGNLMERNGLATVADPTAARELSLYIENEYSLVGAPNSIAKSIDANLRRKCANGSYDPALAPKAWQHLIDAGAKKYEREFGDSSPIFNAATRRAVAAEFADAWENENRSLLSDSMSPNPRHIPEHLQGYEDFTQKDFEDDLRDKGYGERDARYHAARSAQQIGRTNYLPPRVPAGWKLRPDAIFNRRTAKPSFVAWRGGKYQVFDHSGKSLSGELRNMRAYFEWCDRNGYGESASW